MPDFWDSAKGILATVAPTIATALGGPLAGVAVSTLSKAVGLTPEASQSELAAAIAGANTDQLLALKQADNEFKTTMLSLEIDEEKLVFDDRANARERETKVQDSTPKIMGYIVLLGSFAAFTLVLAGKVPDSSLQAGVVIGALLSESRQVLAYFFGDRADSEEKTKLLYSSMPTKVPAKAAD